MSVLGGTLLDLFGVHFRQEPELFADLEAGQGERAVAFAGLGAVAGLDLARRPVLADVLSQLGRLAQLAAVRVRGVQVDRLGALHLDVPKRFQNLRLAGRQPHEGRQLRGAE